MPQTKVFKSAVQFARTEGIVPAPESAHAISVAIDEAIKCREENRKKVIVFNLSGNGLLAASGSHDGSVRLWELAAGTDFDLQRESAAAASGRLQSQPGTSEALLTLANWAP